MRLTGKKKKERGVNVEVSKKAHKIMSKEANRSNPRKTLRAIVNIKNNISEHE